RVQRRVRLHGHRRRAVLRIRAVRWHGRPPEDPGAAAAGPGRDRDVTRVVSLVPSLTEAIAATVPDVLVGATDWCTHPADLDVQRVGGSKYPDLDRVTALRPDVVVVNVEENRRADADALRAAGVRVYVTYPRTVDGAFDELARLLAFLGAAGEPAWLGAARAAWAGLRPPPA